MAVKNAELCAGKYPQKYPQIKAEFMSAGLVTGTNWLEPLMPAFPAETLALAEQVPFQAGKLTGLIAPQMVSRVGGLLRVTNSFYSNLI